MRIDKTQTSKDQKPIIREIHVQREKIERNDSKELIGWVDAGISYQFKIGKANLRIRFDISGYEQDKRPLWDVDEVRKWAWSWLRQQPYCLLLLDSQSAQFLATLCLGGYMSKKYRGFLPDFRSDKASEFETLLDSSIHHLVDKHCPSNPLHAFIGTAIGTQINMQRLFRSIKAECLGIKWWQFRRKRSLWNKLHMDTN